MPVVERRTRSRVPRQQAVLREGWQLQFNVHGEVQRPRLRRHHLPQVGEVGEDLTIRKTQTLIFGIMPSNEDNGQYDTLPRQQC